MSFSKFSSAFALCCAFLSISLLNGAADARGQQTSAKNKPAEPASPQPNSSCEGKAPHVAKIHFFTEQVRRFQNMDARTQATIALGSLLWKCDPLYAETIFIELHDVLKREIEKKRESLDRAGRNTPPKDGEGEALPAGKLQYLRSQLLARLSLLNPALAKPLVGKDSREEAEFNFDMVKSLLEEGEADKAAAGLGRSIASGSSYGVASLLVGLRQHNPEAADALYLSHLSELARRPHLTDWDAAEAGVYVLKSGLESDDRPGTLVSAFVDRTLVPQFALRNPAGSENAFRAYLNFVALLLNQPVENLGEKKWRYALGRVVLQHVPQGDLRLTAAFVGAIQRLSNEVTSGIRADQPYKSIRPPQRRAWENLDQQLEGIQKMPSTTLRDETYLMLLHSLYTEGLYEQALKVVGQMSSSETRDQVEAVVSLAIARQRLGRRQVAEAREMAEKVAPGPGRALFWLEMAQALRDGGGTGDATQLIHQAVADARRGGGAERPLLLLKAANLVRGVNPLLAKQWWLEAFGDMRAFDKWSPPLWGAQGLARGAKLTFALSGVEGLDFVSALQPFVRDEYGETEAAVVALKSERLRADGFVMLARHLLADEDTGRMRKERPKASN